MHKKLNISTTVKIVGIAPESIPEIHQLALSHAAHVTLNECRFNKDYQTYTVELTLSLATAKEYSPARSIFNGLLIALGLGTANK